MSILELFCNVDDFCQAFRQQALLPQLGQGKRGPKPSLSLSEVMTIMIHFHQSQYRTFKAYHYVLKHLRGEFPDLVSYTRFVELVPTTALPMCLYLHSHLAACTGIGFIDATPIPVCHNRRIQRRRVFAGLAERGKTSMGWFYGFKLHLVVNDQLKNISQIAHTCHRSVTNFLVNLMAGLLAYTFQPKKPPLNLAQADLDQLPGII